ncbi:hypothetical protein [Streptomyces sp. NPDC057257]|uniref:hypothetical protein n=1 Tax=Streptomyces sp. NPDC057257 TaxID=3346071 RepID=UPI0036434B66
MAARLDTDRGTVARWRTRFLRDRLDGLSDESARSSGASSGTSPDASTDTSTPQRRT